MDTAKVGIKHQSINHNGYKIMLHHHTNVWITSIKISRLSGQTNDKWR